jgi:hypothetical protein
MILRKLTGMPDNLIGSNAGGIRASGGDDF